MFGPTAYNNVHAGKVCGCLVAFEGFQVPSQHNTVPCSSVGLTWALLGMSLAFVVCVLVVTWYSPKLEFFLFGGQSSLGSECKGLMKRGSKSAAFAPGLAGSKALYGARVHWVQSAGFNVTGFSFSS